MIVRRIMWLVVIGSLFAGNKTWSMDEELNEFEEYSFTYAASNELNDEEIENIQELITWLREQGEEKQTTNACEKLRDINSNISLEQTNN